MFYKDPEDHYKAYLRFLRKENYAKAYHCLENLLHEYPGDEDFLVKIFNLSYCNLNNLDLARKWLLKLINLRTFCQDHIIFAQIEAALGDFASAKQYLQKAKKLNAPDSKDSTTYDMIAEAEFQIKNRIGIGRAAVAKPENGRGQAKNQPQSKPPVASKSAAVLNQLAALLESIPPGIAPKQAPQEPKPCQTAPKQVPQEPEPSQATPIVPIPAYHIPIKFTTPTAEELSAFCARPTSMLKEVQLWVDYNYLHIQRDFGELLCLNAMRGVEKYWHQIETTKKVLKYFRGRVLLCDEVGLGKTIEAGMLIKEYLMRGMAKNILILTPPSLVSQWREELQEKFGLTFQTTEDSDPDNDPDFWKQRLLIASLNLAKSQRHLSAITQEFYDIVVVDEAHRLRNRNTLAWKLVNQLQKKFIFLLTATPVQNNLVELYNLITLLKPGQFKTEKLFKKEYMKRGEGRTPVNREKLSDLLRDVMIRNTRSVINLKLPKRFATTMQLTPTPEEQRVYNWLQAYLRKKELHQQTVYLLLREAGSSPFALRESLLNFRQTKDLKEIIAIIDQCADFSKGHALMEIVAKNPQEKAIIFAQYFKSVDYISGLLGRHGVPHVCFRGDMTAKDKQEAIAKFRDEVPVLVSTESGGEGKNLQFCRTIVNFDLPWNPMRIEQRIGRLHRIGQTRDVFIFNLAVRGTLEDHIIQILDNKINMFEMVIGEIEPILGYISQEDDFENMVLDIWLRGTSAQEVAEGFARLGTEMMAAKKEYLKARALDDQIFGEDYET